MKVVPTTPTKTTLQITKLRDILVAEIKELGQILVANHSVNSMENIVMWFLHAIIDLMLIFKVLTT